MPPPARSLSSSQPSPKVQESPSTASLQEDDAAHAEAPQKTPSIGLEAIEEKWVRVVDSVKRKRIALGSLLVEGWPTRVEGVNLELAFDSKNGFHISSVERQAAVIEEAIEEVYGVRLKMRCVRTEKEKLAGVRKMPGPIDKRAEFAKLEKEDEMIKEIVQKFDAEFIK